MPVITRPGEDSLYTSTPLRLPLVLLVVSEALRGASPALETVGLRGRPRVLLIALVIAAFGAGQAWPALVQIVDR